MTVHNKCKCEDCTARREEEVNWRKNLIEAALKADEDQFIKYTVQLARGIITRAEYMFRLAVTVMTKIDVEDAPEDLQRVVKKALETALADMMRIYVI